MKGVNRLISLCALVVLIWLSLLFGLFLVFRIVFESTVQWQESMSLPIAIVRLGLSGLIALFWLFLWKKVAEIYLWNNLKSRHSN